MREFNSRKMHTVKSTKFERMKINKRVVPNKAMLAGFFSEINTRVDMIIKVTRVGQDLLFWMELLNKIQAEAGVL